MTSDFPGFSTPSAGFEAPLEMLAVCHRRIRTQCATLLRLRSHVAMFGADDAARTAARNAMRYFDGVARHHHEDEEQSLFPALLESMAGSDHGSLLSTILLAATGLAVFVVFRISDRKESAFV